jgi:hypothetical protein
MNRDLMLFWLTVVGVICWPICFLWMYRLSSRQNALLKEIQEQGKRIEQFSRVEHDLIREVHPQDGEIKGELREMAEAVKELPNTMPP